MSKDNKNSLSKLALGLAGAAATAFAAKKLIDLYSRYEGEIISEEDYQEEISREREGSGSLNEPNSSFFKLDLIAEDDQASRLFRKFLENVDSLMEIPNKIFRISDIEKIIPFETTSLASLDDYNRAILEMLSNLGSRDYFMFISNNSLRDIFARELEREVVRGDYWKQFSSERFKVSDKYIYKI